MTSPHTGAIKKRTSVHFSIDLKGALRYNINMTKTNTNNAAAKTSTAIYNLDGKWLPKWPEVESTLKAMAPTALAALSLLMINKGSLVIEGRGRDATLGGYWPNELTRKNANEPQLMAGLRQLYRAGWIKSVTVGEGRQCVFPTAPAKSAWYNGSSWIGRRVWVFHNKGF